MNGLRDVFGRAQAWEDAHRLGRTVEEVREEMYDRAQGLRPDPRFDGAIDALLDLDEALERPGETI